MTPTDFSVLLLAWDDADPSVAVLGGAALPPTLPLVYHLAEAQPVLAVFPHLPAAPEAPAAPEVPAVTAPTSSATLAPTAPEATLVAPETEAAEAAPATPVAGLRHLTSADSAGGAPLFAALLVGVHDLTPDSPAQAQATLPAPRAVARPTAPARSQWPTGANAPQNLAWATPAAPYLGASPPPARPVVAPVLSPRPSPTVREAADLAHAALSWPAGFSPLAAPVASQLLAQADDEAEALADEAAEAPASLPPSQAFDEPTEEIGAAEAHDLSAPEDDLTPNAPVVPPADAAPGPEPALTARTPPLDGLNFRMIQYARQAAQLVHDRSDFGVIYAPTWPAWLAALEIRNSSRRPLVLYAASLAAHFASPAERGWLLEVERMTLRRAHHILVPSEQVRQQLRELYGADTGEVHVVPAADEDAVRALLHALAAG